MTDDARKLVMTTRRIDEIVVGPHHRRDMGDIAALAASIGEQSP